MALMSSQVSSSEEGNNRRIVGEALDVLGAGLKPYVAQVLNPLLPPGISWVKMIEIKDQARNYSNRTYNENDVSIMLRAITERLDRFGYPFDNHLDNEARNYARVLRDYRNQWAHGEPFDFGKTTRMLNACQVLLDSAGASEAAAQVDQMRTDLLNTQSPRPSVLVSEESSVSDSVESIDEEAPNYSKEAGLGLQDRDLEPSGGTDSKSYGPSEILIQVENLGFVNYALAHNRVPIVEEILIDNKGKERLACSVELEVSTDAGPLAVPQRFACDLGEEQQTVFHDVKLLVDPKLMLQVDQQVPGVLRVEVKDSEGVVIASIEKPIEVLSPSHWIGQPSQLGLELLASFVQPNSPTIESLVREASELLQTATGESSLDGYQSGNPARIDAMAEAVYEGVRSRDITYAEPPASWGQVGQKVRTPAEVLDGRLGTCLDTTVTLAAALEQIGINTTLWLRAGHIFLGYWRVDGSLDSITTDEIADVVNLVDQGLIGLIETTNVAGGVNSRPFGAAQAAAKQQVETLDRAGFIGIVDIRQARYSGVLPLPSRTKNEDGSVSVTTYEPVQNVIQPVVAGASRADGGLAKPVPDRVTQWKNSLLDLSLRNRLINYTASAGFSLAVPSSSLDRLEDMINASQTVSLLAMDNIPSIERARGVKYGRDLSPEARDLLLADKKTVYVELSSETYTGRLRSLANKARLLVEETGANNLYLALGMLDWELEGRPLRSPLILIPVNLRTTNRGGTYKISLDEAGLSTPNYCLLEKLKVSFGLSIPGLENPKEDASGIDLSAAFGATRAAISQARLPFRVEDSAELAVLQFAKFRLWKDLEDNWEQLCKNSLVNHLVFSPTQRYLNPVIENEEVDLDELGSRCPVPADASQLEAISAAVDQRTFVLEGPPGTGKSQTITNLLAYAVTQGKRVLFVAEKRAALDVVKDRLDKVGLGEFSLDLHDKGARPLAVRDQLKAALDAVAKPDQSLLESNRLALGSSKNALVRYVGRVHSENSAGLSLYDAETRIIDSDPLVAALPISAAQISALDSEQFAELEKAFRMLPEAFDLARPSDSHPWRFIEEATGLDIEQVGDASAALESAIGRAISQYGVSVEELALVVSSDDLALWAQFESSPAMEVEGVASVSTPDWNRYLTASRDRLEEVRKAKPAWSQYFKPGVLSLDIPAIHGRALLADQVGIFSKKKQRKLVLGELRGFLDGDESLVPLKNLSTITGEMSGSYEVQNEMRSSLTAISSLEAALSFNVFDENEAEAVSTKLGWLHWYSTALISIDDDHPIRGLLLNTAATQSNTDKSVALQALHGATQAFEQALGHQIGDYSEWARGSGFLAKFWDTRSSRSIEGDTAGSLASWRQLLHAVSPIGRFGLDETLDKILDGEVEVDEVELAFRKGVAIASRDERLQTGSLEEFDRIIHERVVSRLVASSEALKAEIPAELAQQIIQQRSFDSQATSGRIGELRREVGRKRGGKSVRTVMQEYGDVITQIMPITLMSPETVARFLAPVPDLFDIVVFDEASQIRVADSIGAMGRGKSVVVVGDSKQMPPTSFAEVSAVQEDAAPNMIQDEESILSECVQAQVDQLWLSWHYRSKDESLIAFSNHHYYDSRLASFPSPSNDPDLGVSLVRVDGKFERGKSSKTLRTNQVEAEAIVDEIVRRFAESGDEYPSIGVVTFNSQQRDLIENLLRDHSDNRLGQALDEPEGLFVKNLENVQGDERDTILFSVAFSANDKGVVPLNFGPLSRPGGERRLNVAITRARRQVILFASFNPNELRSADTNSVGVKHLRAYLESAAQHGSEAANQGVGRHAIRDVHRDAVAERLRQAGLVVTSDVGLSDFRVDLTLAHADDPDSPLVAVLLDGQSWRDRRTVMDRDGLPQSVLKGLLEWKSVERVWLPEWLNSPDEVVARLRDTVETLHAGVDFAAADHVADPSEQPDSFPVVAGRDEIELQRLSDQSKSYAGDFANDMHYVSDSSSLLSDVSENRPESNDLGVESPIPVRQSLSAVSQASEAPHSEAELFEGFIPETVGTVELLDLAGRRHKASVGKVGEILGLVIDVEMPVHRERLAKLTAKCCGLNRVNVNRRNEILKCVPSGYSKDRDGFYWKSEVDQDDWTGARRTASGVRPLEHVSLIEVADAIRIIAESTGGIQRDELLRETLGFFGSKRLTAAIEKRLKLGLDKAMDTRRVMLGESGFILPSD